MKHTWQWAYGNFYDGSASCVEEYPCLAFGTTGLTIVYDAGKYSVTHDRTGKGLGLRTKSLSQAKRYVTEIASWLNWSEYTTAEEMKAARPTIASDLRNLGRFA